MVGTTSVGYDLLIQVLYCACIYKLVDKEKGYIAFSIFHLLIRSGIISVLIYLCLEEMNHLKEINFDAFEFAINEKCTYGVLDFAITKVN